MNRRPSHIYWKCYTRHINISVTGFFFCVWKYLLILIHEMAWIVSAWFFFCQMTSHESWCSSYMKWKLQNSHLFLISSQCELFWIVYVFHLVCVCRFFCSSSGVCRWFVSRSDLLWCSVVLEIHPNETAERIHTWIHRLSVKRSTPGASWYILQHIRTFILKQWSAEWCLTLMSLQDGHNTQRKM